MICRLCNLLSLSSLIASLVLSCSLSLVAHDCCEVVLVTLCSFSPGVLEAPEEHRARLGRVTPLAEHRFSFVQDLAFDMAQFLVSYNVFKLGVTIHLFFFNMSRIPC